MKHLKLLVAAAVMGLTLATCKKDTLVISSDSGPQYYPLATGQYHIYDVDSVHFNDVTLTSDTTTYQVMEVVDSVTLIESGTDPLTWYELKIYRRNNDTLPWQQTHFAEAGISSERAERSEGNLHFINLVFPVMQNKTWAGNAHMSDSTGSIYSTNWQYRYTNTDTVVQYLNTYDSCIVVSQYDNQNLIEKDIEWEVYSFGVGLVYKESVHVQRQDIANPIWTPEKGYIKTMRLREHN
jgi:hypothetical protein